MITKNLQILHNRIYCHLKHDIIRKAHTHNFSGISHISLLPLQESMNKKQEKKSISI